MVVKQVQPMRRGHQEGRDPPLRSIVGGSRASRAGTPISVPEDSILSEPKEGWEGYQGRAH